MPKTLGHEHGCGCEKCIKRRLQTRRNVNAYRERKRQERKSGIEEAIKKSPPAKKDPSSLNRITRHLSLHLEYDKLAPADVIAQLDRQEWKCFLSGRALRFSLARHPNTFLLKRNDPLASWTPDNIRLVCYYAERYVIDPGWGGTLDRFKELREKGLE